MENPVISREYVEKNYIHKDKVREKIKEMNNIIQNSQQKESNGRYRHLHTLTEAKIVKGEMLNLLEETEDENNNTITMQKQEEQSTDSNKQ